MLSKVKLYVMVSVVATILLACTPVRTPIPVGTIPEVSAVSQEDDQYGHQVLADLSEKWELSRDDAAISRVRGIADKLAEAANANQDPWHVYVLEDDNFQNAGATRGNYIFAWTGLINILNDDDELATILAHEMAHVLAKHAYPDPGQEANKMIANVMGSVSKEAISTGTGQWGSLAGLAGVLIEELVTGLIVNPEEQRKELEADTIGYFLLKKAKYDSHKAVALWERLKQSPEFSSSFLPFLSTHPSSAERLENLRRLEKTFAESASGDDFRW